MSKIWTRNASRRDFLKMSAMAGAVGSGLFSLAGNASAADTLNFYGWSAGVEDVKNHVAAFEKKTGINVIYNNAPWAQYRDTMVTKFVGHAPLDVMYVSDSWLPEWADAGWIAPINGFPELMKYNDTVDDFCTKSMQYNGKQYGLTYYSDYMAFLYDEDKLKKAGIKEPPKTWDEVVQQSLILKKAGICEYPMMLPMARESWLIEFMTALVYSHGGRFTDDNGFALMDDPKRGAHQALQWITDAVNKHKIISPACVETGELTGLKAFGSGNHAFGLLSRYRVRTLNDPTQSQIAGHVKQALMPAGPAGSHETVGWMRFHAMSAQAAANKTRAAEAAKFIEWFGGKADGKYQFQKTMFTNTGTGFGEKELFKDPDILASYKKYGDIAMFEKQQQLVKKKDVITRWFGEWDDINGAAWQSAVIGKSTVDEALKKSAQSWNQLKKQA
ncbi:MAG: bacterial extracellular solute-binding family protein [Herbaspirillum sp.]|nr:bacterial extracellular solute-binding family protein [Herbaspirillum sp.]